MLVNVIGALIASVDIARPALRYGAADRQRRAATCQSRIDTTLSLATAWVAVRTGADSGNMPMITANQQGFYNLRVQLTSSRLSDCPGITASVQQPAPLFVDQQLIRVVHLEVNAGNDMAWVAFTDLLAEEL